MDKAKQEGRTLGQSLGWLNNFLYYTDEVCRSVPEAEFDARFTDPKGNYFFSAGELMMHIADSRWDVIAWINGSDYKDQAFLKEFGGHEKPWVFKEGVGKEEILKSLEEARAALAKELERPAADYLAVTDSMCESFEKRVAAAKEKGQDTAELEATGPSCIGNSLMFMAGHEQAHRGELQWLMRTRGADVFRFV